IEWYKVGDTYVDQMQVVEELVVELFRAAAEGAADAGPAAPSAATPFSRTTYRDAFRRCIGADVLPMSAAELAALAGARGVPAPEGMGDDRDGWLNLL